MCAVHYRKWFWHLTFHNSPAPSSWVAQRLPIRRFSSFHCRLVHWQQCASLFHSGNLISQWILYFRQAKHDRELTCFQNIVEHFGLDVIELVDVRKYRTIFRRNLTQIAKFGHIDRSSNIYMENSQQYLQTIRSFHCTKWIWSTSRRHMVDLHTIAVDIPCQNWMKWSSSMVWFFQAVPVERIWWTATTHLWDALKRTQQHAQRVQKMLRVSQLVSQYS